MVISPPIPCNGISRLAVVLIIDSQVSFASLFMVAESITNSPPSETVMLEPVATVRLEEIVKVVPEATITEPLKIASSLQFSSIEMVEVLASVGGAAAIVVRLLNSSINTKVAIVR